MNLVSSLSTFCEKYLKEKVKVNYSFVSDVELFSIHRTGSDSPDLEYNEEFAQLTKKCLIDNDSYSSENDCLSPYSLRYVLRKWISGSWKKYQSNNEALLSYAVKLIQEIYKRQYAARHITLHDLEYYQTAFKQEWVPNTDYIPGELREAIETCLVDVGEETLGLGENITFFRNYYASASDHVLRKLHNRIAEACVKRDEITKCSIM